jgi:hypothetical protein
VAGSANGNATAARRALDTTAKRNAITLRGVSKRQTVEDEDFDDEDEEDEEELEDEE